MHQHDRHAIIVERARETSRVEVAALANELDVTPETVRRDLTTLERHGLLRRVHGGAIAIERVGFEPTVDARSTRHTEEKQRIAEAALALLPEHGTILIDSGTTAAALAERLPVGRELTVVTNSLPVTAVLSRRGDLTLHSLGGRIRPRTLASVGEWTITALGGIHADVAFLGSNGLSVRCGLTTPDQDEAATKRAMVACAARVVALVDSSKIGTDHFAKFGSLDQVDTVVTDTGLDPETADEIRAAGPEVLLA